MLAMDVPSGKGFCCAMPRLLLDLDGTVRLTGPDGADLTPGPAKVRGLLALLGAAPRHRLSRIAVQETLWSDRMPEQANGSLRRALSDLRDALGDARDALEAGTGWIGLDPARVDVRMPAEDGPQEGFAADLDLGDPAFRAWLRARRARAGIASGQPAGDDAPLVLVLPEPGSGGHPLCDLILRDAARRVAGYVPALIGIGASGRALSPRRIDLGCTALPDVEGGLLIDVHAEDESGRQVHGNVQRIASDGFGAALAPLSEGLSTALLGAVSGLMADIHSFDPDRLRRAHAALASGATGLRGDVAPALLGHLTTAMVLDRVLSGNGMLDEATARAAEGIRRAPGNPVALGAASLVASTAGRIAEALDLAHRAETTDMASSFVQFALAIAQTRAGAPAQAARHAAAAGRGALARFSPAVLDMSAASAAVLAGREAEALSLSRRALRIAPTSRPAMRFVAALSFRAGEDVEAAAALEALSRAEPGFAAGEMAEPDYPVASLREAGMLDVAYARHLGGRLRSRTGPAPGTHPAPAARPEDGGPSRGRGGRPAAPVRR